MVHADGGKMNDPADFELLAGGKEIRNAVVMDH